MSEGGVLFSRGKCCGSSVEEDQDTDNPWDDTLLIQAYDRAVNLAKLNLQKNLLNTKDTKLSNKVENKTEDCFKEPKNKPKESPASTSPLGVWRVGSKCRAVWSHDHVEYEAEIISIKNNKNQACVKFVGYNNKETTKITSLKPSQGEAARQQQISASQGEAEENGFSPSNQMNHNVSQIDEGLMFPPPPPPHIISYLPKDEQEALSAMLMSWYMSGYHTGYYQGLIAGRSNTSFKKK